jgi:hypothetical protein
MHGPPEEQRPDEAGDRGDLRDVGIARAFRRAWGGADDEVNASPELLPVRLTRACVEVLGIDGAGLSLFHDEFRVPLGASDDIATIAERLQFTQGEGPCLESAATRRIVVSDADEMESRWPAFAADLFRLTPYCVIMSLPLALSPRSFAALDLYVVEPRTARRLTLTDVHSTTEQAVHALASAVNDALVDSAMTDGSAGSDSIDEFVPLWLTADTAQARTNVWVAMGMVMTKFELTAVDAIALLRSYAYGHDQHLDDVAVALVEGRLTLGEMQR